MSSKVTRRNALGTIAALATLGGSSARGTGNAEDANALVIDPAPEHELSPYLFMQFMEPLGATDGSVEAAWDHAKQRWRPDVIDATKELSPTLMRWGGIFTDYYRWREGVGPRDHRKPIFNLLWDGIESNQIGTAEFVDFCRQVQADPLMCVNFESDGRERFMHSANGVRTAGAEEAAEWVAYCNRENHRQRIEHGFEEPHNIKLWQIGNETSYDRNGFDLETAARKTVEFAKAMRSADPSIQLIGWGDSGWAGRMLEVAGEHLQYIAFHHMFNPDNPRKPVLGQLQYRQDPDRTWEQLISAVDIHERKIREVRQTLPDNDVNLAMTECHFAIPDRDRCDVLSSWAAGVAYARMLNLHERHGDVLKIATAADFCGNRWQVNAVMIPTPRHEGPAFLMPVARVMSLYRNHIGEKYVGVDSVPDGLDVTASRTGDKFFLHVVNTRRSRSIDCPIRIQGMTVKTGKCYEIAVEPEFEITRFHPRKLDPKVRDFPTKGNWSFPAASVSAIELQCASV